MLSRVGVVALVGGESTGKTTLASALAEQLPAEPVAEYLRSFVEVHRRVPGLSEQASVMAGQVSGERVAVAEAIRGGLPWVVSDSGALMTAVYSIAYYQDSSLIEAATEHHREYALTVLCGDEIPWEAEEGQRDGPEARSLVQGLLVDCLSGGDLRWLHATGSVTERVAQVRTALLAGVGQNSP